MSEWKYFSLEELVFVDKEQLSNSTERDFQFYYIDISCVSTDTINFPNTPIAFNESPSRARKVLHNGDVLMATVRPNLKAFAKFISPSKSNFIASTGFAVLSKKESADLDFIYHSLFSYAVEKQIDTLVVGSNYPALNTSDIRKLRIFTPDLLTQRQIAKILSTADAVIEKTQAAIDKYKAIKQGMLHDLFTRGIDISTGKLRPKYEDAPELYKESKLGWIPREWEVKRLEDIADYVDYRGKTPPKSEFGIYLITARNIKNGIIDYEISKEYIREDSYESAMSRGKVKLGDVLITTEAPMGNVAQIDKEDIALAQRVIKYRGFESKLNNDFLSKFLMSENFQRQLSAEATGSTVLGIKGSRLHKLKIVVPEIDEQVIIAERIKTTDKKIESEQNYLLKLQKIKSGLMSDLLSGKKRVTIKEEEMT